MGHSLLCNHNHKSLFFAYSPMNNNLKLCILIVFPNRVIHILTPTLTEDWVTYSLNDGCMTLEGKVEKGGRGEEVEGGVSPEGGLEEFH